jgi:2',3'-cyclic-nucleotide 2'-phosphodiesterase/3'-nucleotidase
VAAAEIMLSQTPDGDWEKSITSELVQMKDYKPDKKFMQKFSEEFEEIKDYVSKPLGTFTKSISTKEAVFGNSAFVDLIHKIQLDISNAEISFAAPLSFNAQIDSGKVFVKDMFKLYKYENFLYTIELTGEEIDDYLEYSYSGWFNTMQNEEEHLLNFVKDENGELKYSERYNSPMLEERYYNFDNADGIDYIVDISKPNGDKVEIKSLSNGKGFSPNEIYKVAVNSYRGNGGGGHLTDGVGIPQEKLSERVINSTEKDLRFYMMKWIESQGTVIAEQTENWKIIPQDWWEEAKERDYRLLYD